MTSRSMRTSVDSNFLHNVLLNFVDFIDALTNYIKKNVS